jgi:hypothetical protein
MDLKIDELTKDGYEFCKTYINHFKNSEVPQLWNDDYTQLAAEVNEGERDHEYIHIPVNMKRWIYLIIAERYIKKYEEQHRKTIQFPFHHKSDISTQEGNSASQSKTGGKFQSVNIAGDGPVSSKCQVSGSGLCVEARSSHITGRRRSNKRSTARRLRRRSSKARNARNARKSRSTRRR